MKRILFLCTHNSCRSQMAEALLRHRRGEQYEVFSAGTEATEVNPFALEVLGELNIDTTALSSKALDIYWGQVFDEVITVCDNAKEACPFFSGAKVQTHQGFTDPPDLVKEGMDPILAFRKVRDDIDRWIVHHF